MTSTTCTISAPPAHLLSTLYTSDIILERSLTSIPEDLSAGLKVRSKTVTISHPPAQKQPTTLSSLPPELLIHILSYLTPADCTHARLTSRLFNTVLASRVFHRLPSFLDEKSGREALRETLAAFPRRPRSIWSPDCSVPDRMSIPESFLLAMYVAMMGKSRPMRSEPLDLEDELARQQRNQSHEAQGGSVDVENESKGILTVEKLAKEVGKADLTENVVRAAMFQYMLFLSYVNHDRATGTEVWTISPSLWRL